MRTYYCKECDFVTTKRRDIDSHAMVTHHKFGIKQKRKYMICLKSHTEAPDYEATCLASSKPKAAVKFAARISKLSNGEAGWEAKDLEKYIQLIKNGKN